MESLSLICRLSRPLGSIWPSTYFTFTALMLRGVFVIAKAMSRNKLVEFFASLPSRLVGLAASGSAHHWARVDQAWP